MVVLLVTLFSLFSWLTIVENDCEIADVSVPDAKLNTTATRSATNARIAPYSVIPCPDSSEKKLLSEVVKFIYLPPRDLMTSEYVVHQASVYISQKEVNRLLKSTRYSESQSHFIQKCVVKEIRKN